MIKKKGKGEKKKNKSLYSSLQMDIDRGTIGQLIRKTKSFFQRMKLIKRGKLVKVFLQGLCRQTVHWFLSWNDQITELLPGYNFPRFYKTMGPKSFWSCIKSLFLWFTVFINTCILKNLRSSGKTGDILNLRIEVIANSERLNISRPHCALTIKICAGLILHQPSL